MIANLLRDVALARKLTAIILIIGGSALVGAFAVFLVFQWVSTRNRLAVQLDVMASVVGDQSTAALEFGQKEQGALILASLKAEPQIIAAAAYDAGGAQFAHYVRGESGHPLPSRPGPDGVAFEGGDLLVFKPILSAGERIGTLHLRSDMSAAWQGLRVNLGVAALVLALSAIAMLLLSRQLGRVVSDPVIRLAKVAEEVSTRRDYSVRAASHGRDELGRLVDGFNDMLSQIQVRDNALAAARDDLERRVEERTRELQVENGERRAAEKLLQASMADLASVNKELEGFSYSVSHDLRAPLRAINGFAGMLVEDHGASLDPEARRYLQVIQDNTRKMGQLIDDLLAFSRLGRKPVDKTDVDLKKMAADVFAEIRPLVPDRAIEFRVGDLPKGPGDPALLHQVLVNLISNAVKYTRSRPSAVIEIGARVEPGELIYFVRDNGVGFDMEYAHKLFGVFQRLHSTSEFEGTGVGLALVQRIIQRHGGRVWGEGKVGEGATFFFTLPLSGDGRSKAVPTGPAA